MELEFDKEIDAILRRGRVDLGAVAAAPSEHVDADVVAAFVENSLPVGTRSFYIEHFADCGRCRKLLSQAIFMGETAASMAAVGAAEVVSGTVAEAAIPWYQRIFRMPGMAVAMGALVLTFGGALGYLVLESRQADSNASVAQVTDQGLQRGPSVSEMPMANANSTVAANSAQPLDGTTNSSAVKQVTPSANPATTQPFSLDRAPAGTAAARTESSTKDLAAGTVPAEEPKAAAAPPPPPVDALRSQPGVVAAETARERDDDKKGEKEDTGSRTTLGGLGRFATRRDMPAPAAKAGPSRAVGPVQNQANNVQTQTFEMPVTRVVSGKTFDNRDRAWYDRAYRNQPTINVRRGTDEFKKLDSGLRSIANTLGGVVVVVWKDKAYRIQ